jgi:protein-S-isoprenylcysteine O-methyltransferase
MTNKLLISILAPVVVYLGPALGNAAALHAPQLWLLVAVTFLASITQPNYKPVDRDAPSEDRGTATQIVWTVYFTQALGVLEALYLRYPGSFTWDTWSSFAIVSAFVGMLFRAWAVRVLGVQFTWHIRASQEPELVTQGPYQLVRHPGYSGALLLYVGTLIVIHAWVAAALSLIGMLLAFSRRLKYEERQLERLFGGRYDAYRSATKGLIPYVW